MIYIQIDNNGYVLYQHNIPFDPVHGLGKTEEELLITGILVDNIPLPYFVAGKQPITKYDNISKQIYFEYVDIPMSDDERKNFNRDQEILIMKQALDELILGGL